MSVLLYCAGALAFAIGIAMAGYGIPINEFSFGNTLIVAGATLAAGGMIVFGLGVAVNSLQRLTEALTARPVPRAPRQAEAESNAVPRAPVQAQSQPPRVPFPAKPAMPPVTSRPEPDPPRNLAPPRDIAPPEPHLADVRAAEPHFPPPPAEEWRPEERHEPPSSVFSPSGYSPAALPPKEDFDDLPSPSLPNPDDLPPADDEIPPSMRRPMTPPSPAVDLDEPARRLPPLFRKRQPEMKSEPEPELDPPAEAAPVKPTINAGWRSPPPTPAATPPNYFDSMWPAEPKSAAKTEPKLEPKLEPKIEDEPEQADDAAIAPAPREDDDHLPPSAETSEAEVEFGVPPAEAPEEPRDAPRTVAILKSGVVDGMGYTLYVDGSIEAELPQGTLRFASINELRAHLEKS